MTRRLLILILIVFLGLFLRIWKVGEIPPGVNRDEASIGYTAYSILKTHRDEYGTFFPLSIKSFGDWKLPLYIYFDIVPVKLFSLNEFSVRLPSVLFGTLTIIVFYLLILELVLQDDHKYLIALVGTFFLSISPWHIHFSRVASEANLAVFLVAGGIYLFIKGLSKSFKLALSSIFLSLSLYAYHGSHVFSTLLFFILICFLVNLHKDKRSLLFFITPFFILAGIIFSRTLFSADKTKLSGLFTISDTYFVYDKVNLARVEHEDINSISTKVLHNKASLFLESFIQNYIKGFSPEFLFIKGGGNLQHNIPNFGNLYIVELVFIILGIYFLFTKSYQWRWLLLSWLLIAPIPAAITKDAPHTARMLAILPLPHLFSAIGFIEILLVIRDKRIRKVFIIIIVILLFINKSVYLDRYFIHFPIKSESAWGGGYKELSKELSLLSGQYKEILMDRPDYSPYIYFLFYNQTDPRTFQSEVIRYPEDQEGFQHVKTFRNMTFKKLDWSDDLLMPNRLLVSWASSTPIKVTASSIKEIRLKNGEVQFYLIEIR